MNQRAASSRATVATAANGEITLNFVNADVREVIRSVLGDTLKLSFTIDQNVQGVVTLQTSRPLPRAAVLGTLEIVLQANAIAVVPNGNVYKVVPIANAARIAGAPRLLPRSRRLAPGFGSMVVPLRYAAAQAIADILKPFTPPESILAVDADRNLLIVAGTSADLRTVSDIVSIFDVDWFTGTSFALVELINSKPQEVVGDLQAVFGEAGSGPLAGLVRLVPFDRINSVLIVTSRPEMLDKVKEWIGRLDLEDSAEQRRLFVYRVENGRATDLAEVLGRLYSNQPSRERTGLGQVAPGRQSRTLRSSSSTSGSRTQQQAQTTQTGTTPRTTGRTTSRSRQRPRQASQAASAEIPVRVPGSGGETTVRIIADDVNNSLLILATGNEYRQIEAALRKLDVEPIQVLIEATIAEVTLTDELRYGVQWFLQSGNSSFNLSNLAASAVAPQLPGFAYVFSGGQSAQVVLDALDSVTEVNLLSSPQVLVKDNRTATIEVGDQVPIATQSSSSVSDPDAPIVNSIEFRDTGVLLQVTPRVNASGLVSLDIEQEVSNAVATTTSGIDSPTIQQRRIESTVAVHDGETIVLGGLIESQSTTGKHGIPLLSQIPILGNLFGRTEETFDRTELLILITPRVIRNRAEARKLTDELRSKIGRLTRSGGKKGSGR